MKRKIESQFFLILCLLLFSPAVVQAQDTPNARQARRIFDQTLHLVFGNEGCRMNYAVALSSFYRTSGTIWMKGRKRKYIEPRYSAWNDGVAFYRVDERKHTVEIYHADSRKRDKYLALFQFSPDDYTYQIADSPDGLLITLHARSGTKGIRHVKALVDRHTFAPKLLKIKVAFFWATIKISGFQSGGIRDDLFHFPRETYRNYQYLDKRHN